MEHREDIIEDKVKIKITRWKKDTQLSSSISEIILNQSYLEIIGMGKKVLPYIFQDLEHNDAHWFSALRDITGCSPVKQSHRGNIKLMKEDWLKWGEENGYITGVFK